jgi:hypothetical protein
MRRRLRKELIGLLPAWGLAVAVPLAGLCLFGRLQHLFNGALALFAICTAVLGAAAFGAEFEHRTLPLLLTQPVARRRLWREKMVALAAALASASAVFALTADTPPAMAPLILLPAACAFGLAPFLALVLRNGLAAAALTVGAEAAVYHAVAAVLGESPRGTHVSPEFATSLGLALLTLSAVGYALGRATFRRWQAAGWSPPAATAPQTVPARPRRTGRCEGGGRWVRLAAKEFRLHRLSLFAAAVFCAAFAVAVLSVSRAPDAQAGVVKNLIFVYGLVAPAAVGAATVATERGLGLLEWHLTLPPSVRTQWVVKSAVAFGIGLGLGFLLPWALVQTLAWLTPAAGIGWFSPPNYLFLAVLGVGVGVHTSATARSPLRAFTGAFGVLAVALFFHDWLLGWLIRNGTARWIPIPDGAVVLVVAAGLVLALNWSAFVEYRSGGGHGRLLSRARQAILVILLVGARVWLEVGPG